MTTIVFDIETGPLPEAELLPMLPPFDPAEVKTGNIKDPEKIAAKIAEAEAINRSDFINRAALDALTGRVLAIGYLAVGEEQVNIIGAHDEAETLRKFWDIMRGDMGRTNQMIGFNSHLFDLPFLVKRSLKHRVAVPRGIRRGRYWAEEMVDLREVWQLGDRQARGSLDAIARFLGIGGKSGNGADFAKLWETDRHRAIAYLRNDVELTAKIACVLGVI